MMLLRYVDLETAKTARGVRMAVSGVVPSPWSEAAKALFRLANVPVLAVRAMPRDPAVPAWTGAHNVPAVFHDDEPPRTVWSQIVALADRLAGPGALLPEAFDARVETMGLLDAVAGEGGLGWNARLLMIDAGLRAEGARGFPRPVAAYLGAKYGHHADVAPRARTSAIATLARLDQRLGGRAWFAGERPGALDAYVAAFLTPLHPLPPEDCAAIPAYAREAFGVAADELGPHVPKALDAHWQRMLREHMGWPIEL